MLALRPPRGRRGALEALPPFPPVPALTADDRQGRTAAVPDARVPGAGAWTHVDEWGHAPCCRRWPRSMLRWRGPAVGRVVGRLNWCLFCPCDCFRGDDVLRSVSAATADSLAGMLGFDWECAHADGDSGASLVLDVSKGHERCCARHPLGRGVCRHEPHYIRADGSAGVVRGLALVRPVATYWLALLLASCWATRVTAPGASHRATTWTTWSPRALGRGASRGWALCGRPRLGLPPTLA